MSISVNSIKWLEDINICIWKYNEWDELDFHEYNADVVQEESDESSNNDLVSVSNEIVPKFRNRSRPRYGNCFIYLFDIAVYNFHLLHSKINDNSKRSIISCWTITSTHITYKLWNSLTTCTFRNTSSLPSDNWGDFKEKFIHWQEKASYQMMSFLLQE